MQIGTVHVECEEFQLIVQKPFQSLRLASTKATHFLSRSSIHSYLDGLQNLQKCGYKFANSTQSLYVLKYADDTGFRWSSLMPCHADKHDPRWRQGSKCQAIAIEASTGKIYDPKLKVTRGEIPFAGNHTVRSLGGTLTMPTCRC